MSNAHILSVNLPDVPDRRENTVLRGELFERTENDPVGLSVSRNVYVIPNAFVAAQFKPSPIQPSLSKSPDTSKPHLRKPHCNRTSILTRHF